VKRGRRERISRHAPYGWDFGPDGLLIENSLEQKEDAFSFDGLHYGGACYCQHCRENFRKDTGKEVPKADMNDPAFRR
jgi:hypothetical protein